jgi:hypothetical protein
MDRADGRTLPVRTAGPQAIANLRGPSLGVELIGDRLAVCRPRHTGGGRFGVTRPWRSGTHALYGLSKLSVWFFAEVLGEARVVSRQLVEIRLHRS